MILGTIARLRINPNIELSLMFYKKPDTRIRDLRDVFFASHTTLIEPALLLDKIYRAVSTCQYQVLMSCM